MSYCVVKTTNKNEYVCYNKYIVYYLGKKLFKKSN